MRLVGVDAKILQGRMPMLVRGGIVFGVAHIYRSGCTESVNIVECLVTELSLLCRNVEVLGFLEEWPGRDMVLMRFFEKLPDF